MKPNTSFKQAVLLPSAPALNRRQLLVGMAATATAALLAAKPWGLAPAAFAHIAPTQPMGAFEALRIFLQASARPR